MESVEYYRKAFKLDPTLEDETVAQRVLKSYRPRVHFPAKFLLTSRSTVTTPPHG